LKFLLDTNAVVAFLKGQEKLTTRMRSLQPSDIGLPSIVAHELFYGAFRSARQADNLSRVEALQFEVLDLDREDAFRAGQIRARLADLGTPIGPYDVLIAGQALARDLVLVTRNTPEFERVEGLKLEDWES
jgi:tRNA(fMet)-specific endonuclease VapC